MFPLNYLNGQVENGDEHGANTRVRAHFRFGVAVAVLDAENAIFEAHFNALGMRHAMK